MHVLRESTSCRKHYGSEPIQSFIGTGVVFLVAPDGGTNSDHPVFDAMGCDASSAAGRGRGNGDG